MSRFAWCVLFLAACSDSDKEDTSLVGPVTGSGTTSGTGQLPPRAQDDSALVDEGGSVDVAVSANDLVTTNPLALGSITVVDPPANGLVSTITNGTISYQHDGSETSSDSFTYTIEDDQGFTSNIATVALTIVDVNDPPVAVDDAAAVNQGATVTVNLSANDVDVDDGLALGSIDVITPPEWGSLTLNANGSVDYAHGGAGVSYDSFEYTIEDMSGDVSNVALVSMTVNTSNAPPVAVEDAVIVQEGAAANVNVAANDSDADDGLDLASITVITPPAHGTALPQPNGTIDYVHDGSETVSDSFTYRIRDFAMAPSNTVAVQVLVAPVNDPPVAYDDAEVVIENQVVNVVVLDNDIDPDSPLAPASVAVVDQPLYGTLAVQADGSIDYTHDGSQQVADTFTYTVTDTVGALSNVATVDIEITLINDPPTALNDADSLDEGSSVVVDLAGNDSDPDDGLDLGSIAIVTSAGNGSLYLNGDGTVTYTHDGSETSSDSFTYTILDLGGGVSNAAVVSLTVNPVNDPPVATADADTVGEGASKTVNLAANDSDPDDGLDLSSVAIGTAPVNGGVVVNGDGTVDYTHNGSETVSDSFTYTIRDQAGVQSGSATVTLTITPANDSPVAVNDGLTLPEGSALQVAVLSNDTDADDGLDSTSVTIVGSASSGTTVVLPGGDILYTHNGSEGPSDSFSYTVRDLAGAVSNAATVTVTVQPVNDPPVAVNDSVGTLEAVVGAVIPVLSNDSDADDGLNTGSVVIVSAPSNGVAAAQPDGTIVYDHDGSNTVSDVLTYTVQDNSGAVSNIATVNITVTPVNDPPTAVNDSANVNEGSAVSVNVLANDSDPDDGLDPSTVTVISGPSVGTAVVQVGGTILYTHNGSENFSTSFTYRVRDFAGANSNTATVSVTVNPVNDAPTAVNDSANVNEGAAVVVNVLANDSDPDDGINPATVTVMSGPSVGTAVVQAGGTILYTHNGSENFSTSFTYRVQDFAGANSNTATVSVTINPVNDPPTAVNDSTSVNEGAAVSVTVLSNDSDPDDGLNPGSVVVMSAPSVGTAVVQAGGTILYTHNGSENFSTSFTYRVQDFAGANSNTATVSVTINPVNDPPTAVNDSGGTINNGAAVNINVAANDTDPDNALNLASVVVISSPSNGSAVVIGNGTVTYTHNGSATLSDSFTYRISDVAGAQSNTATVSITINPAPPCNGSQTFNFTGGTQTFIVPCTDSYSFQTYGAQGQGGNGGLGGYAAGVVSLTAGESIRIVVGGMAGYNGGGAGFAAVVRNGGGASDVRRNGTGVSNRILVAGGGGGGGPTDVGSHTGGAGGGGTCGANYCGGGGAAGYGGAGGAGGSVGGAGNSSSHSGGAGGGGLNSGGFGSCNTAYSGTCGGQGALGAGGAGDTWETGLCYNSYGGTSGGGGGYYGGGGSSVGNCGSGGGGGGSSWTGTMTSQSMSGGVRAGDGQVTITW